MRIFHHNLRNALLKGPSDLTTLYKHCRGKEDHGKTPCWQEALRHLIATTNEAPNNVHWPHISMIFASLSLLNPHILKILQEYGINKGLFVGLCVQRLLFDLLKCHSRWKRDGINNLFASHENKGHFQV